MLFHEVIQTIGISKKGLNYYEEKGLIRVEKNKNGYREYKEEQLLILWKIKVLRQLDFSISEIEAILHDEHYEEIFQNHFNEVDKRIAQCETQKQYIHLLYEQKEESCTFLSRMDKELRTEYGLQDSVKVNIQEETCRLTMFQPMELFVGCLFLFQENMFFQMLGLVFTLHSMYFFIRNFGFQDTSLCGVALNKGIDMLVNWWNHRTKENR